MSCVKLMRKVVCGKIVKENSGNVLFKKEVENCLYLLGISVTKRI